MAKRLARAQTATLGKKRSRKLQDGFGLPLAIQRTAPAAKSNPSHVRGGLTGSGSCFSQPPSVLCLRATGIGRRGRQLQRQTLLKGGGPADRLCKASTHPPSKCRCRRKHLEVSPEEDIHTSSGVMQRDGGACRSPQARRKRQNHEGNLSESNATFLDPQTATESGWVCRPENHLCGHSAHPTISPPRTDGAPFSSPDPAFPCHKPNPLCPSSPLPESLRACQAGRAPAGTGPAATPSGASLETCPAPHRPRTVAPAPIPGSHHCPSTVIHLYMLLQTATYSTLT